MGLDYGEKRIGVAVSDPLELTAQAVATIENTGDTNVIEDIKGIMGNYSGIEEIVIGLPKNLKGEIGPSAQKVLDFVEILKKEFSVPITAWDERMTTVQAERMFQEAGIKGKKRRGLIDKTAAAFILQNYLDRKSMK